ncbi:cysteine proteinase inhibitor 5 [Andrographis paniculata]|uniref:cysteine proteinase inhibitor 5 n=1 Tax=Andrographis paniculata TaxID=175694 RepID=UPI0021E97689|nr:cysteine proteinase inhibitor 5 [Andrographis paniculata]
MASKFLPFLFVVLSLLAVALPYGAAALAGGWKQISNPKDPEIVRIGQFAVSENNKEKKSNLQFVTVVSGETQVVAGTNYKLVISAKDASGSTGNYRAVVWSKPWQKFTKLMSFEKA